MKKQFGSSLIVFVIGLLIGAAAMAFAIKIKAPDMLITEIESPLGHQETIDYLESKAKELTWKVPKKWKANFQKNFLKIAEIDIGPAVAIKMCEPYVAARLLVEDENKHLMTLMPCTYAVYQKSNGKTYVSMMNLEIMGKIYGGDVQGAMEEVIPAINEMVSFK